MAHLLRILPRRINEIVLGKRAITADIALRLARYFGLSEGFWLGLQFDHDLLRQRRKIATELGRLTCGSDDDTRGKRDGRMSIRTPDRQIGPTRPYIGDSAPISSAAF